MEPTIASSSAPRRSGSCSNLTHFSLTPLNTAPTTSESKPTSIEGLSMSNRGDESPAAAATTPTAYTPQHHHRTSYIAGKSAPTTPGILSRNHSSHYLFAPASGTNIKDSSKSYTHLAEHTEEALLRGASAANARRKKQVRHTSARFTRDTDGGEWLFRSGTAISGEARESKGQSWLVSRESSTSLLARNNDDDEEDEHDTAPVEALDMQGRAFAATRGALTKDMSDTDLKRTTSFTSATRRGFDGSSHPASARTSRRTSRIGSRAELAGLTPSMSRQLGSRSRISLHKAASSAVNAPGSADYFGPVNAITGPDFVNKDEVLNEDEGDLLDDDLYDYDNLRRDEERRQRVLDEAEVAKLTKGQESSSAPGLGFGLGGLMDKVIGWTLFDMKDDGGGAATSSEDEDANRVSGKTRGTVNYGSKSGAQNENIRTPQKRSGEEGSLATNATSQPPPAPSTGPRSEENANGEEENGWSDAAWLLSVASKALF